jgi:hypothetical protein
VVFIKKVSIFFLTISIFFTSLILPIKNASAFTIPEVSKATKIIRALGEKIGIKWSAPSLYATVGYILADNTPEGLSFVGDIPIMDGQIKPDDYQEYLLDPIDWKNGIKLIDKATKALVPESTVPIWGNCTAPIVGGDGVVINNDSNSYYHFQHLYFPYNEVFLIGTQNGTVAYPGGGVLTVNGLGDWRYYKRDTRYTQTWEFVTNGTGDVNVGWPSEYVKVVLTHNVGVSSDSYCDKQITADDVPNITNINTTIINNIDNSTTYIMPIDVPVTDDPGDVTVPWNPPLTPEETDGIFTPPPKDTDNDGIPDDTDITPGGETPVPDDTGIFAKLFPVLLIVKLFGVLGSCLMYLVRMFQFIMTIPGIDAIPIDNDAFVWFRSAQIVGIKIYDVVSSLAGVGLSFIVFRAIRRAYL